MSYNPFSAGQYKATPPVIADGQYSPVQLDTNGNTKVAVQGTVPVSGTFWQATQPVSGTFWQATQPVSGTVAISGSVAVTGVFYQATQPVSLVSLPALVAGSAIIGHVGIDQTTPGTTNKVYIGTDGHVTVDNGSFAVTGVFYQATQPVSLASLPALATGTNIIGEVKLTDGTYVPTVRSLTNSKGLNVSIIDGSGDQITSFGGGTQYAAGVTQATPTGTVSLAKDASNILKALLLDASGYLKVNVAAGGAGGGLVQLQDGSGNNITSTASALDVNVKSSTLNDPAEVAAGTTAPTKVLVVAGKTNDGSPQYREIPEGAGGRSVIVEGYAGGTAVPVSFAALPTGGNVIGHVICDSGAVVVSGTVAVTGAYQGTQPVSLASLPALVAGSAVIGHVIVDSGAIACTNTGTFATQPTLQAATTGGLSFFSNAAVSGTKTAVKAGSGQLYGWQILNTSAAIAYVQIFNLAIGSVTVGVTPPDLVLPLPANGGATFNSDIGIAFSTQINIACTTTATGSTGAACAVAMFYK